jgi:Asp-tRNA(Asn)/Glu-tRNA(Gln) amidotransferase A subunit family amidase
MSLKNPGPINQLAKAISEKKLTSTSLIEETIRRLEASELNAVSEFSFESALKDADEFDRGNYSNGPLGGLPVAIKDLEDWKGHPTKKGSVALDNVAPATANGVVPQRLFEAGAIGIAKTTLPEFAIEGFTSNLLNGSTTNPWNQKYSTGGSSGGSAALVASGAVAIGTATDGGGSIRIPSSLCGLVGIKPTNGLVGRWPVPDWIDLSTDGPFATSTDDLKLLLDVIIGSVAGDPSSPRRSMARELTAQQNTYTKLIVAERTSPLGPLPAGVLSALKSAAQVLSDLLKLPLEWRDADDFFTGGLPDLDWFTIAPCDHVASLGRQWVQENMHLFHRSSQQFLGVGLEVTVDQYQEARRRRFDYSRQLSELLGNSALLITPTVASEGWLADGRLSEEAEVTGLPPEVYSTAVQNVTGNPAISIPMGTLPTGLPFGIQITAPHYCDYDLLRIAELVEGHYPWQRVATGYEALDSIL